MTTAETVAALLTACRTAGVDAEMIFAHYSSADIAAFAATIGHPGGIPEADLHLWMATTAQTISEGRCLCDDCKVDRSACAAAEPGRMLCPSCSGRCTGCGTCGGRGWGAA